VVQNIFPYQFEIHVFALCKFVYLQGVNNSAHNLSLKSMRSLLLCIKKTCNFDNLRLLKVSGLGHLNV